MEAQQKCCFQAFWASTFPFLGKPIVIQKKNMDLKITQPCIFFGVKVYGLPSTVTPSRTQRLRSKSLCEARSKEHSMEDPIQGTQLAGRSKEQLEYPEWKIQSKEHSLREDPRSNWNTLNARSNPRNTAIGKIQGAIGIPLWKIQSKEHSYTAMKGRSKEQVEYRYADPNTARSATFFFGNLWMQIPIQLSNLFLWQPLVATFGSNLRDTDPGPPPPSQGGLTFETSLQEIQVA